MKRRVLRLLVLLWLGWYLSGPMFETIDSWDSPQEEIADIARNAGGTLTLLAVAVCVVAVLFRKVRERCAFLARVVLRQFLPSADARILESLTPGAPTLSPPCPLRI